MSKKTKIATAIAVATLATAVGAGGIYAACNHTGFDNNVVALNNQGQVKANTYYRVFPKSLKDQGIFHYGGLKYDGTRVNIPQTSDTAATDELLILYHNIEYGQVRYSQVDFTQYKALKDVIIVANDLTPYQPILEKLTSGVNLYLAGGCNLGTSLANLKFTNIYLCNQYVNSLHNLSSEEFTTPLTGSSVTNVYYNDFIEKRMAFQLERLMQSPISNKNGQVINIKKAPSIKYPDEVFYIVGAFTPESRLFGCKTHYVCDENENITHISKLNEVIDSIDKRVKDTVFTYNSDSSCLDMNHKYGKVFMSTCDNLADFSHVHIEEFITTPAIGSTLDFSKMPHVKALRLRKAVASPYLVNDVAIPQESELKKIYIPNDAKELYANVISNPKFSPIIEYYDQTEGGYYNSYTAADGKVIKCVRSNISIEQYEKGRLKLDTMKVNYDKDPIDELLMDYEIRMDDTIPVKSYGHRSLNKIVVPKNMDAKKILEEYKFALIVDEENLTLSNLGSTIEVDASKYTVGTNGTIKVTITYPDKTKESIDVAVEHMLIEGTTGYVLGETDICAITKVTTEKKTLIELMQPLMEKHLMEASAEYVTSPILDTTKETFICANSYRTVSNNGKLRVLTTNNDLVEPAPKPSDPDIDNGEGTDPENPEGPGGGGGETPKPTPGTDTDGIDLEGLVLKNPLGVYTPSTIDGSKLFTGVRDVIATYKGNPIEALFAIGYNKHDNTKDWEFSISNTFELDGKKDHYSKRIPAKIIKSNYNIGFIVFEDGTIAVEYNFQEKYTAEQVKEATAAFLKSIGKEYTLLAIPETNDIKVYEGNYDENKIIVVNSGYNLTFTSEVKPDEQTEAKKGYKMPNTIYYTKNFTKEQVLRVLADKLLRKDGVLVKDYEISFNYKEEEESAEYIVKVDGKELLKQSINFRLIESEYEYIFTTMNDYDSGALIMNIQKEAPKYTLNAVMSDALKNFRGLMSKFSNETTIDFTKAGKADVDGTYLVGNGSYYKYEYDVEVMDINKFCEGSEVLINGKMGKETIKEKFDGFFANLKKKFEENKVFKGFTIAFGTITGLALLYGLYIIFKKTYKWLRG